MSADETELWIDSHCHLSAKRFSKDRGDTLQRARSAGTSLMIEIGCEPGDWQPCTDFVAGQRDLRLSLGLHPHEARHWSPELAAELRARLAQTPEVCAIGEMGLDYHYNLSPEADQRRAFHEQLELAEALDLPAVFHIRDAHEEAAKILAEHPRVRGIVHCFTGNSADVQRYLELGHDVSFSGIVTFKNATDIQDAARLVPLDRLLVETDAPYLAPLPHRGKRNEPAFVGATGRFLAQLLAQPVESFAARTRANTRRAFCLEEELGERRWTEDLQ